LDTYITCLGSPFPSRVGGWDFDASVAKKKESIQLPDDNAGEVTVIRMAQLRCTFPLISGSERARPRVSHR